MYAVQRVLSDLKAEDFQYKKCYLKRHLVINFQKLQFNYLYVYVFRVIPSYPLVCDEYVKDNCVSNLHDDIISK